MYRMPSVADHFRKRATNYRVLLRKITCKDKASYDSTLYCSNAHISADCLFKTTDGTISGGQVLGRDSERESARARERGRERARSLEREREGTRTREGEKKREKKTASER